MRGGNDVSVLAQTKSWLAQRVVGSERPAGCPCHGALEFLPRVGIHRSCTICPEWLVPGRRRQSEARLEAGPGEASFLRTRNLRVHRPQRWNGAFGNHALMLAPTHHPRIVAT